MVGKVLELENYLKPDMMGCEISRHYQDWETFRQPKVAQWTELSQYVYATDTSQTTNSKLPWSNKTTIPKLCQIRDNLYANYMASMFPKRKWLTWEGDSPEDEDPDKKKAIESYISWVIERNEFYDEVAKLVLDYIDYGNAFVTVEWADNRNVTDTKMQVGYVGPMLRRISPLDIVMNPVADSFTNTPKIVRTLVTLGEVKEMIERMSHENEGEAEDPGESPTEDLQELYDYMLGLRSWASQVSNTTVSHKDCLLYTSPSPRDA